jgi:hypothetical protein
MMWTRCSSVLAVAGLAATTLACEDAVVGSDSGAWHGDWVQVNFLDIDDRGIWDADDLSGIGFVQTISETEWVLTDDYGAGCAITFSYSVNPSNRFARQAIRAGSRCPPGVPLSRLSDSGRLEFSSDGRFMTEYYDRRAGDEIVAFKFVRR